MLAGLLDPELFGKLEKEQATLREEMQKAGSDPQFQAALAAYDKIQSAQAAIEKNAPVYNYYESERRRYGLYRQPPGFAGTLFKYARFLVRLAEERNKPNGERLPAYQDSSRPSLELDLLSSQPVYADLEILLLSDSLTDLATRFGDKDPLVQQVLAAKSPAARAAELVSGTKVKELGFRKKMWNADSAALTAANDPMLALATLIDPTARAAEHQNREPFHLPARWMERKDKVSLGTKFNFVCDADIIGGNSGSPVVNQAGQFVGIIFDGNIQSLVSDYVYDDQEARAVSVDSAAIIEALRNVYDAAPLANELVGKTGQE